MVAVLSTFCVHIYVYANPQDENGLLCSIDVIASRKAPGGGGGGGSSSASLQVAVACRDKP